MPRSRGNPDLDGILAVRTNAELRLRRNGIRVLGAVEGGLTPGRPWLYLKIQVIKIEQMTYVFFLSTQTLSERCARTRLNLFDDRSDLARVLSQSVGWNTAASYVKEASVVW